MSYLSGLLKPLVASPMHHDRNINIVVDELGGADFAGDGFASRECLMESVGVAVRIFWLQIQKRGGSQMATLLSLLTCRCIHMACVPD